MLRPRHCVRSFQVCDLVYNSTTRTSPLFLCGHWVGQASQQAMTTPFVKGLNRSASKRARSTDSSRSATPAPVPKALKTQEDQASSADPTLPAFLRQSATGTLLRQSCIGDANLHNCPGVIGQRLMFDRNQDQIPRPGTAADAAYCRRPP